MWLKKITKNPCILSIFTIFKLGLLKLSSNDIIKGFMPLVLILKKSY